MINLFWIFFHLYPEIKRNRQSHLGDQLGAVVGDEDEPARAGAMRGLGVSGEMMLTFLERQIIINDLSDSPGLV